MGDINNIESVFGETDEFFDYQNRRIERSRLLPTEDTSITIIHFWASWCEPCITEIPELLQFIKDSQNSTNGSKKFIVVSLDENFEDLTRFLKNFPELDKDPITRVWDSSDHLSK